jgi:hypothetical protein
VHYPEINRAGCRPALRMIEDGGWVYGNIPKEKALVKNGLNKGYKAGPTGLEPATSNVTGWRSNQTELRPRMKIRKRKSKIRRRT